jgi:Flp pilus assembly protein TadG
MAREKYHALRRRRATAAVEFAVILPLMMLLVGGIVEFGRLFQVYNATNRLATQYALAWANCSESSTDTNGVCSTELSSYITANAIGNVAPQLTLSDLTLTMAEFTVTQGGTATAIYSGGYSGVNAAQLADATTRAASAFTLFPGPAAVQYVVVVEAKYAHSLDFFETLMEPFLGSYLNPACTAIQLKS